MKRYNLSEIMTNAHRTYKYVGKKQGKTFGEVLKATWRLAKVDLAMKEAEARRKERLAKESEELKNDQPAKRSDYDTFSLTWNDCYNSNSRGHLGAQYCGD